MNVVVPRDVVTPDDLNVTPELLGAPLARPGKRLLAIAVDVSAVALLSNLGNVWLLAGLGLIALMQLRPAQPAWLRRRWPLWTLAALLIALGSYQAWHAPGGLVHAKHRHERGRELVDDDLPSEVRGLTPLQAAQARITLLQAQLAEAHEPKSFDLREQLRHWGDDVGLSLGWAIVYFSLLPVWWKGQTLGKRLFGLRVVELTGKPLTPLRAFKRYGGYAAGMATGMFGFLQVLWDPNRQAIQDKTAHTVVIDLRRKLAASQPAEPPAEESR